ncbi:hypothetical protein RJ640_020501, partial [Escallonia rubra]
TTSIPLLAAPIRITQRTLTLHTRTCAMELLLASLLLLALFSLSFLLVFHFKTDSPKFPPGNTGWPIVGETLELVSENRTPDKFIDERRTKHSPEIFKTSLAGETMAVLCSPAGNKFLFSNENKLVVSWWPRSLEKITMSSSGSAAEKAKRNSGFFAEFLKPDALKRYVPIIDSMVMQHLETEWNTANNQVKAYPLSKKFTFAVGCKLFMSIDDSEHIARLSEPYAKVAAGLLSVPVNFPGTTFSNGIKAANFIRVELTPIIEERRRKLYEEKELAAPNLMSHILLSTDENGMSMTKNDIADTVLGALLASHETVAIAMSFVLYYLADHPDVYAKVLKEQLEVANSKEPESLLNRDDCQKMKYSRNVINEALRLQPPAVGGFKHVISDFTYAGFTVPKGWKIFWSTYSTNKDPKYFPNPEKFDPSRFEDNGPAPYTFIPFGGGARMCPGAEFSRLEILIFVHRLITKFRWEKLIPDEKIVYKPMPIPVDGLPIRLVPRENKAQSCS